MNRKNRPKPVDIDLTLDELKNLDREKIKRTVRRLQEGLIDGRA